VAATPALAALLVALAVLCWPARPGPVPRGRARLRGGRPGGESAGAAPTAVVPVPVVLDLLAAALAAGLSTAGALTATLDAVGGSADDVTRRALQPAHLLASAGAGDPRLAGLARAVALADRTGASAAVLLRAAATDERAARRRRAALATGRLGVRLVLPLGLTTLPAFVLLGVVPVVIGLAGPVLAGARGG
jgi:tight adherence protein B